MPSPLSHFRDLRLPALAAVALAAWTLATCTDGPAADGPAGPGAPIDLADSAAVSVVPGGEAWLHGDARDSLGVPAGTRVAFASEDSAVATVDSLGRVVGRRVGRTAIVAVAGGRSARLPVVVRTVRYREVHPAIDGGCALTTAGEALCWGRNDAGSLGAETYYQCSWLSPRAPYVCGSWPSGGPTFVRTRARFVTLAVAWGHRCGLTADGRALCWGARPEALGDSREPCDTVSAGRCAFAPREEAPGARWRAVATGAARNIGTTCALDGAGAASCWGWNRYGQTGTGRRDPSVPVPTPVLGGHRFRAVALSEQHACAVDEEDAVWCWGSAYYAGADTVSAGQPELLAPVPGAGGLRVATIGAGYGGNTCGLTRMGEAWCWWFARRPVLAPHAAPFTRIGVGDLSACALTVAGEAWCWPAGFYCASAGIASCRAPSLAPERVAPGLVLRSVAVASDVACGMGADGVAYCWRYAAYPGPTSEIGPPTPVPGQPVPGQG